MKLFNKPFNVFCLVYLLSAFGMWSLIHTAKSKGGIWEGEPVNGIDVIVTVTPILNTTANVMWLCHVDITAFFNIQK